jgi:hypothetical protein
MEMTINRITMIRECKKRMTSTIKIIRHIKIVLVAQFVTLVVAAQPGSLNIVPKTGNYEDAMQLSYDSVTKEVSGYVKMDVSRLDNPKKVYRSCAVLFIGKTDGSGTARVDFYNSPDIKLVTTGDVVFDPDKITLTAKSGEGYCNDILDLTDGLEMDFAKGRPYIGCRAVNKVTTYLYSSPVDSARTKMYLLKGDMVMILGVKEGWVKIEYIGKKIIDGWIRKSELSPGFRQ